MVLPQGSRLGRNPPYLRRYWFLVKCKPSVARRILGFPGYRVHRKVLPQGSRPGIPEFLILRRLKLHQISTLYCHNQRLKIVQLELESVQLLLSLELTCHRPIFCSYCHLQIHTAVRAHNV